MQLKHDEKITDVPSQLRTGVPWLRQRHVLRKFVDAITAAHASVSCVVCTTARQDAWPLLYVFLLHLLALIMIPRLNTGSQIFLDTDRKSYS